MLTFIGSSEVSSKTMVILRPEGGCEDGLLDTQVLGAQGEGGSGGQGVVEPSGCLDFTAGGAKHLLTRQVRLRPA